MSELPHGYIGATAVVLAGIGGHASTAQGRRYFFSADKGLVVPSAPNPGSTFTHFSSWSPDGKQAIFSQGEEIGGKVTWTDLWLYDLASGRETNLTKDHGKTFSLQCGMLTFWPKGCLTFRGAGTERNPSNEIYSVSLTSGEYPSVLHDLSKYKNELHDMDVSSDGTYCSITLYHDLETGRGGTTIYILPILNGHITDSRCKVIVPPGSQKGAGASDSRLTRLPDW